MAKKNGSTPTMTTWDFTKLDFTKMIRDHLGIIDGDIMVTFPENSDTFMVVLNTYPDRAVKIIEYADETKNKGHFGGIPHADAE